MRGGNEQMLNPAEEELQRITAQIKELQAAHNLAEDRGENLKTIETRIDELRRRGNEIMKPTTPSSKPRTPCPPGQVPMPKPNGGFLCITPSGTKPVRTPVIAKPYSMQRYNKLREVVPEIVKLAVAKQLIERLWPAFMCTTPTITLSVSNLHTLKDHIEAIKEDLNNDIMSESTASSTVKNLGKSALAFLKSKTSALGNLGKAQVASKLDTIAFLDSVLSNTKLEIPCEQAKLLAIRLVTFYDLNPLEYSGKDKSSKHLLANTRKAERKVGEALAKYYGMNTNIFNSFIHNSSNDEDEQLMIRRALKASMKSNTNGKKVLSLKEIVEEAKKARNLKRQQEMSSTPSGTSSSGAAGLGIISNVAAYGFPSL
jgi:prefoldin subunit 5